MMSSTPRALLASFLLLASETFFALVTADLEMGLPHAAPPPATPSPTSFNCPICLVDKPTADAVQTCFEPRCKGLICAPCFGSFLQQPRLVRG